MDYTTESTASGSADKPEVTAGERAQVTKWNAAIDRAYDERKKPRERNKRLREYVRGAQDEGKRHPDDVTANIVLGMMQTLVPLYYAKDPELDVAPDEQVEDASYGATRSFADTSRIVLNRKFIREPRLKQRITRAIPSALTNGVAWFKVIFQRSYGEDPLIRNRINDLQDNMARLEKLLKDGENPTDPDLNALQIKQQIEVLQQQLEVETAKGFVIDYVNDDDVLILDDSLTTFSEYVRARAIAHGVWMSCDDYEQQFGKKPTGSKYADKDESRKGTSKDKTQFVYVQEIWSLQDHMVYTMERGASEYARAPYSPTKQSQRWYPLFALYWNEMDGQLYPVSDVEQWVGLQDEYNRMRTQLSAARRENKPGFLYRKGGALTEKDLDRIKNRNGATMVGVETNGANTPLNQDLAPFPTFPIDPTVYDATMIQRDLEQVSGASDAARAAINKAKTATEAGIQAEGMQTRTAFRQDNIEELITEMATSCHQMALQEYTPEDVTKIAGQGAVWPSMPRAEIYEMLLIQVKAGSTGKPNMMQKRQDWVALAPQIVQFIQQVYQFRAQGLTQEADGILELLQETFKVFDVRMDLQEFFPPMPPGAAPMATPVLGELINAVKLLASRVDEVDKKVGIPIPAKGPSGPQQGPQQVPNGGPPPGMPPPPSTGAMPAPSPLA